MRLTNKCQFEDKSERVGSKYRKKETVANTGVRGTKELNKTKKKLKKVLKAVQYFSSGRRKEQQII